MTEITKPLSLSGVVRQQEREHASLKQRCEMHKRFLVIQKDYATLRELFGTFEPTQEFNSGLYARANDLYSEYRDIGFYSGCVGLFPVIKYCVQLQNIREKRDKERL